MPEQSPTALAPASRASRIGVIVAMLWTALLCSAHYDQLFLDGHLGYAGSLRGVIGHNYQRLDPIEHRFAPLQNGGPTHNATPSVRFNHPPLSAMLVGLSFAVFGTSEAAARIVPIAASVLTVPLLFGWVRRLWNDRIALLAVGLWCLSPFVAIYGAMVSYEPLVLCAWNLLLLAWASWHREPDRKRTALILAGNAIGLGLWTDWPMVVLAGGVIALEGARSIARRPRRPAFALAAAGLLLTSLGALAIFYLVILDVDSAGLQALYRARSSVGSWNSWDVTVHIFHRTAVLLTWPVVGAALLGWIGCLTASELKTARLFLLLALLAPPLVLLVTLPQHAVIHCFSAWYLLPAATVGAATATWLAGRFLSDRFGPVTGALPAVILAGLVAWQAAPVVADGWVSDGSPFEERPRLRYRHLVLARWAGAATEPDDELLVDPTTGAVGVRAWFQHRRQVRRLRRGESLVAALGDETNRLALLSRERLDDRGFRELADRHATTIVADAIAIDARRPRGPIAVLELRETEPSVFWKLARSASYPPHRLVEAPGRAAVYELQLRRRPPADLEPVTVRTSLAELAARHLLSLERNAAEDSADLAARLGNNLTHPVDEELCPDLRWVGADVGASHNGRTLVRLLFQTTVPRDTLPVIRASLRARGDAATSPRQWVLRSDDFFEWPASAFITATHRLPVDIRPGLYDLQLRGCGRRLDRSGVTVHAEPPLPVMPSIGRI